MAQGERPNEAVGKVPEKLDGAYMGVHHSGMADRGVYAILKGQFEH